MKLQNVRGCIKKIMQKVGFLPLVWLAPRLHPCCSLEVIFDLETVLKNVVIHCSPRRFLLLHRFDKAVNNKKAILIKCSSSPCWNQKSEMGNSKMFIKFLRISKEMLSRASPRLQKTARGKQSTFLLKVLYQHLVSMNQLMKWLEKTEKHIFMDVGNIYLWCKYKIHASCYLKYIHYLYTKLFICQLCI